MKEITEEDYLAEKEMFWGKSWAKRSGGKSRSCRVYLFETRRNICTRLQT